VEDDAMNPAAWVERHARRQPDDPALGEAVVAFVVAADNVNQPSVTDLDRTCLDHIARFKRPMDYRFVDALTVNNYGKVVKRELRDRLQADVESSG
jgi:acyl-CoA synthetase (AMP-forming)/AMP-acid ligase II